MTIAMMLDLETIGTTPRAVVLQAGWCIFDTGAELPGPPRGSNVDIDSCIRNGGEVTDGAVRYWLRQPELARESVAAEGQGIEFVLASLVGEYIEEGCAELWAHSPSFDVVIVEHYMRQLGIAVPWTYKGVRDTRTFWAAAELSGWRRPGLQGLVSHIAWEDAVAQAHDVQSAYRHLRPDG